MPHYKDGTEAKVGDVVKGKAYNTPHEIIGKVVQVRAGPSSAGGCTLSVAFVGKGSAILAPVPIGPEDVAAIAIHLKPRLAEHGHFHIATPELKAEVQIDSGDTVGFEKIA